MTSQPKKSNLETFRYCIAGEELKITLKWSDRRKTIQLAINQEQQIFVS